MLCFPWKIGLWEVPIITWLSTKTFVVSFCSMLRSIKNFFNHNTTWLTTAKVAINSSFAVNFATISCFLEHHEKMPEPRLKQYPEVLSIFSKEPPQSI